jgi:hypothetical protein
MTAIAVRKPKLPTAFQSVVAARCSTLVTAGNLLTVAFCQNAALRRILARRAIGIVGTGRQVSLACLLLLAINMTLAGEPLGLDAARDLLREVRHTYPELVD